MKLVQCALGILGVVTCARGATSEEPPTTPIANEDATVQGAYIVELDNDVNAEALYSDLRAEGLSVSHRMDLKYKLFNGVSFRLGNTSEPHAAAAKIASKPQIKNMWPVRKIQFPKPDPEFIGRNATSSSRRSVPSKLKRQATAEDKYSTHLMAQVDKLRAEGFTGKGIRVAVVDTGIDYRHPALGGCFGPGCLVEYGHDLVGDDFWPGAAPVPDNDPIDTCQGHGTHVAGIIAAQENELGFTGVAPDVKLGAFKVSGCPSYTTNEILIAGFNMAYEAGSDIISCSAGDDSGWAFDPSGIAASRIAEQGVPVIVATGNSGNLGVWQAASPASGVSVAAIGSVDNTIQPTILTAGTFTSSNGSNSSVFGWRQGTPAIGQRNLTMPLWAVSSDPASENDACEPLPDDTPDLSNYITLVRIPSNCNIDNQATNIFAKGGKNILFYPQTESQFQTVYVFVEGIEGTGLVVPRQGAEWVKALGAGQKIAVTLTVPELSGLMTEDFNNGPRAGYMSAFSSWGPTYEVQPKPQFVAPGGNILSTWTWDQGEYAVNGGTSMSTPFAAGVYALVGQARGNLNAKVLRNIISATAKPNVWHDSQTPHDILAPVAQQGAGLVQAYDAAHATTILSVNSISFNDTDHFTDSHTFSIENTGKDEVTFKIGHAKAATVYTYDASTPRLYPTRDPQTADAWAALTFDSTTLTIPAGGTADVHFTVAPPSGLNNTLLPVYSGYITLNGTNGENLSLPYVGVSGSLHNTRVLTPGQAVPGSAGVYLSSTINRYLFPVDANQTFTIPDPRSNATAPPNTVYPKAVIIPAIGSSVVRVDVVAVGNSSVPVKETWLGYPSLGLLPDLRTDYWPHIGFTSNFFGYTEDRTVLPSGVYRFVVSALRIFGDAGKREDWDVVEMVPFTLEYL